MVWAHGVACAMKLVVQVAGPAERIVSQETRSLVLEGVVMKLTWPWLLLGVLLLVGCGSKNHGPPDAGPVEEPPDAGPISAFQCEGVPAPADVFRATRTQCRYPDPTLSGMGLILLSGDPYAWFVRQQLWPANVVDAYLAVPCGQCEVRSEEFFICGGADRGDDYHAGEIALTTDTGGTARLVYAERNPDIYLNASGTGPFFSGGETLRVSATGGRHIAAFSHEMTLPSPVTITQPTPSSLPLPLRRGEDVDVRWTGAGAGHVMVSLFRLLPRGSGREIVCRFPAGAGAGTIPGDLLRTYEPGEASLFIWRENTERIRPSNFELHIRTTLGLTRPDGGNGYSLPVQLHD